MTSTERGDTIRRHYPARPVEPHEYAAWRAVLGRAERNAWYCGPDDRARTAWGGAATFPADHVRPPSADVSAERLRYAADGWHAWRGIGE